MDAQRFDLLARQLGNAIGGNGSAGRIECVLDTVAICPAPVGSYRKVIPAAHGPGPLHHSTGVVRRALLTKSQTATIPGGAGRQPMEVAVEGFEVSP